MAILVTATGGGIYWWQTNKANQEKARLEQDKANLETKIQDLQKQTEGLKKGESLKDETANWKIYTNPTFGYSIKYPVAWTEKQGRVLEAGVSEDTKNMVIEFYDNSGNKKLQINTEYKTKWSRISLAKFANEYVTPKDKSTITNKVEYQIGSLKGYKELVTITDPSSKGLWYFAESNNYFFVFITSESTQSSTIKNMLASFLTG